MHNPGACTGKASGSRCSMLKSELCHETGPSEAQKCLGQKSSKSVAVHAETVKAVVM